MLWGVPITHFTSFESYLLPHNVSPKFTNTKKVCFSIQNNMFMLWGVPSNVFLHHLNRIFYHITFHQNLTDTKKVCFFDSKQDV